MFKRMSVIVEYAIFPTDKGASVSDYVSQIIKMLEESGLDYQLTSMGSIYECATMQEALAVIQKSHDILAPVSERIYATAKFDIRKNRQNGIQQKLESIKKKL